MGKALGALVFAAGVAGLGYWGARSHAVGIEAKIREAALPVTETALHPIDIAVSGRDILLSGTLDTPEELDKIVSALDAIRGRRVVRIADAVILPDVSPYETAVAKGRDGTFSARGYAPSAAIAALAPPAEGLPLGHGAPEGWTGAMAAGIAALDPLDEGSFTLTGTTLTLSGVAQTPAEERAALNRLGDLSGFDEIVAIDVTDPGIVDFRLSYDVFQGYALDGILPGNLGPEEFAARLGVDAIPGKVGATFAELPGLDTKIAALGGLVALFERFTLSGGTDGVSVSGEALAGLDAGVVTNQLAAAIGSGDGLSVVPAPPPVDGADRIVSLTGARQVAHGGSWIAVPDFAPSKTTCAEAALEIVEGGPILFLTGSANLDPVSLATINAMAGLVLHCTEGDGKRVTIGGHTDAEGDDTANFALSLARARAVRDALIARGVPAAKLTAIGYGETEPVADNDTDEGRTMNRRTTFAWPD